MSHEVVPETVVEVKHPHGASEEDQCFNQAHTYSIGVASALSVWLNDAKDDLLGRSINIWTFN